MSFIFAIATSRNQTQRSSARKEEAEGSAALPNAAGTHGSGGGGGSAGNQQQDWSILWSCFDNPLTLLSTTESLPKGMHVI